MNMPQPLDISSEEYRVYTYASGDRFTIVAPVALYRENGGNINAFKAVEAEEGATAIRALNKDTPA